MAVNYETGVANTPTDLLDKLRTFAVAHGWTAQVPSSGDVVLSRGTIFVGVDATSTSWNSRGALAFSGAAAYNAQPNAATLDMDVLWGAGPYTAYHFYVGDEGGADYIHVTVELTAGRFQHWVIGELVKSGAYTGGTYVDGCLASTADIFMPDADNQFHRVICDANHITSIARAHIWVDYDAKANNWQFIRPVSESGNANGCAGSYRNDGIYGSLMPIGDIGWNLRTPLFPAIYYANRASNLRSPIGRIPNFRLISLRNFTPGEQVTYGGVTWQVFPIFIRRDSQPTTGNLSSGYYGYAHRR